MRGLLQIFVTGAVAAAGLVVGTKLATKAVGDLSNPVKKTKMKSELISIKNRILNK